MSELDIHIRENSDATIVANVLLLPDPSDDPEQFGSLIERRAKMVFRGGQWVQVNPAFSDRETLPPNRFDFSNITSFEIGDDSVETVLANFRITWIKNGVCPDPRVYEIDGSDWLKETRGDRFGLRHFVLKGADMWMEILSPSLVIEYAE